MTPTTVPAAEFTSYLLQQTGLRASLLQASLGCTADDRDDLRQDLALDCLRRLPKFDASRGDWRGFVCGVVRNHGCVLALRQIRRREYQPAENNRDLDNSDESSFTNGTEPQVRDFREILELSLDTQHVIARLPEDLQLVARGLCQQPISAICQSTGLSRHKVKLQIGKLRAAFEAAGFSSVQPSRQSGGRR